VTSSERLYRSAGEALDALDSIRGPELLRGKRFELPRYATHVSDCQPGVSLDVQLLGAPDEGKQFLPDPTADGAAWSAVIKRTPSVHRLRTREHVM